MTGEATMTSVFRTFYLLLGVAVARYVYQRRMDGDTLTRLREIGGV